MMRYLTQRSKPRRVAKVLIKVAQAESLKGLFLFHMLVELGTLSHHSNVE